MDMEASWERWYRRKGKAILEQLEARRQGAVREAWIAAIAVTIAAGLWVRQAGWDHLFYMIIMMPMLWVVSVAFVRGRFQHHYKTALMPRLVRRLGGTFTYAPRGKVPREWYDRSGLFFRRVSGYGGEDLLTGEVGGMTLTLGELEVTTPSGDTSVTVFKGLFISTPLQAPVQGRLTVMMNSWTRVMNRSEQLPEGLLPLLDFDGGFGARFQVRGTDEGEARRVLTPDFQEKLMAFASEAIAMAKADDTPIPDWQYAFRVEVFTEPTMALSIVDNQLFIAIHTGRDLFDPKLTLPANHPGTVKRYMTYLEFLTGTLVALGFVVEDADAAAEAIAS